MKIFIHFRYFIQKIVLKFNFLNIEELLLLAIAFSYSCAYKIFLSKFYVKSRKNLLNQVTLERSSFINSAIFFM